MKRVTFETALRLDGLGMPAPYSEYCEVRDAYALNEFSFLDLSNKDITVVRGDFIKDYLKSTFDSSDDRCIPQNMISAPTLDEARDFLRECYGVYLNIIPYWDITRGSETYGKTHFMLYGHSLESVERGKCFDGSFTADYSHYDDYEVALEDLINIAIDKIDCGEV